MVCVELPAEKDMAAAGIVLNTAVGKEVDFLASPTCKKLNKKGVTQNIYDTKEFFANYSKLDRSTIGLDATPEWPVLQRLAGNVDGLRVLDLGCGWGLFARWACKKGAKSVVGYDVSENMLAKARAMTAPSDGDITFIQADLHGLELHPNSYDLIFSSLVFHYLVDLPALMSQISAALRPGGRLTFSVEHPIRTAPLEPEFVTIEGRNTWPVSSYCEEGERKVNWLAEGVLKQHRTVSTYINLLIQAGLTIVGMEEHGPSSEQVAGRKEWAVDRDRPTFMLLAAEKRLCGGLHCYS